MLLHKCSGGGSQQPSGRLVSELPTCRPTPCKALPSRSHRPSRLQFWSVRCSRPIDKHQRQAKQLFSMVRTTHRWLRAAARSICRRKDLQAWQLHLFSLPMASTSSCPARPQPQWNHLQCTIGRAQCVNQSKATWAARCCGLQQLAPSGHALSGRRNTHNNAYTTARTSGRYRTQSRRRPAPRSRRGTARTARRHPPQQPLPRAVQHARQPHPLVWHQAQARPGAQQQPPPGLVRWRPLAAAAGRGMAWAAELLKHGCGGLYSPTPAMHAATSLLQQHRTNQP